MTLVPDPTALSALQAKRPRGRPRKPVDAQDDGNRRRALLEAAGALFRRQGFAATTTRDIASAAGMQSGSPFYHFKNKEALLYAVMDSGMRNALERQQLAMQQLIAATVGTPTPLAQLRTLVHVHCEVLLGPGNDFVPVMLYEARSLALRQRKLLAQRIAQYEALWTPPLSALHASGQLRAPVALARLLILGSLNWSVQWFDPAKTASPRDVAEAALALYLKEC